MKALFIILLGCILGSDLSAQDIYVRFDTAKTAKILIDVDGTPVPIGGSSRDTIGVQIIHNGKRVDPASKRGKRILREADARSTDIAEQDQLDHLMNGMMSAFFELLEGDSTYLRIEHEQALWLRARSIHCREMDEMRTPNERRELAACKKWASIHRLEDLLELYDSLAK